jgi:hypothetical protein
MNNVQLTGKESVKVFVEIGSNRILGFSPEFASPLFTPGTRYTETLLLHSRDVERWVGRYRQQQERDAEEATYRQIKRESIFRKSLRSAILERNKHVNPLNRDLNNVLIRLMDEKYDAMMKAKMKPVVHGMAEASEASKTVEDFALESRAFKAPIDPRVSGSSVAGALNKIEYDKAH